MVVFLLDLALLEEVLFERFGSEMRQLACIRLPGVRHAFNREQVLQMSLVLVVVASGISDQGASGGTYLNISLKL